MAFDSSIDSFYPFFAWDLHSLGFSNPNMSLVMESHFSSDSSTGYLQDAVAEWSDRSKRRRVTLFPQDQTTVDSETLIQDYWNWNFDGDPFANGRCWSENTTFSDDPLNSSINSFSNGATVSMEAKAQEATTSEKEHLSSSPPSYQHSMAEDGKETSFSRDPLSSDCVSTKRKKKGKRVAYPFAVVKPGGVDGDVTLNDINERILMRPTRPVRHPVGEFACHPCVSGDGLGLSGKAVVALTRIHTGGRGTVTIIRTRG